MIRPLCGVDRDLRHADHEAGGEILDAEGLVEQVGGLLLELDGRALEDRRAVVARLERLERAAVEEEQRSALGGDLAVDGDLAGQDRLAGVDLEVGELDRLAAAREAKTAAV